MSTTLTVRLPDELKERLARLAGHTRRTSSFLAAEAIERYVARELEIVERIEQGLADLREGRTAAQDDVMDEIEALLAQPQR